MFKFHRFVILIFLSLGVLSCTRSNINGDDPRSRLNDYITKSFSVTSPGDRTTLMEYLTGDSYSRLAAWSDQQFTHAFIEKKRSFVKLTVLQIKKVSPQESSITYELVTMESESGPTGSKRETKITHKKLAQMIKKDDVWKISDVKNIAELIEFQNEMSLP